MQHLVIYFYLWLSSKAGPSPHGNHGNSRLGGDKLQHGGQGGAVWRRRSLLLEHQTLEIKQRLHNETNHTRQKVLHQPHFRSVSSHFNSSKLPFLLFLCTKPSEAEQVSKIYQNNVYVHKLSAVFKIRAYTPMKTLFNKYQDC